MYDDNNVSSNIPILRISEPETVEEINNLLSDIAEVGVDQLIKDGVLRDIPLIGSAVGILKVIIQTKDSLLLRNVARFRYGLQNIAEDKKKKFIEKLRNDKEYSQIVGENLLLLLNRVDDIQKPELLANLFKAFIAGDVDDETYQNLAIAIDRIRMQNIRHLIAFYNGFDGKNFDVLETKAREIPDDALQDLMICGLIDIRLNPNIIIDSGFTKSKVIELGKKFIEIVLKNEVDKWTKI